MVAAIERFESHRGQASSHKPSASHARGFGRDVFRRRLKDRNRPRDRRGLLGRRKVPALPFAEAAE